MRKAIIVTLTVIALFVSLILVPGCQSGQGESAPKAPAAPEVD